MRDLGFRQVRLRHHGELARIEIDLAEMQGGLSAAQMEAISATIRPLGFKWVCVDLEGYRLGSLNRGLPKSQTISLRMAFADSILDSPPE